ncbi:MAG: hypothetical protein AAGA76_11825 [Pseudomonadota bacterium]
MRVQIALVLAEQSGLFQWHVKKRHVAGQGFGQTLYCVAVPRVARRAKRGAAEKNKLELPPVHSILDELEEWEQYLKVADIDRDILENVLECVDITVNSSDLEQLASENISDNQDEFPSTSFRVPSP